MNATETYRQSLIEQLNQHTLDQIQANLGGWATDRLDAIKDCEYDLAVAGVDFEPYTLAQHRYTN